MSTQDKYHECKWEPLLYVYFDSVQILLTDHLQDDKQM